MAFGYHPCEACNERRGIRCYDTVTELWLCHTCRQASVSGTLEAGRHKDDTPEPITP